MGKQVRLDKYLCSCLDITRKEAKEFLKKGKVQVKDQIIKKPEYKIQPETEQVLLDGKKLSYEEFHYLMLHKPAGVVSATKDRQDSTVLDLISESYKNKLFPVGRLDKDTEGLLLLTDDGELAHNLLSPKKHVKKVYFARVSGCIDKKAVELFSNGISIGNGEVAKPAELKIIEANEKESLVSITITEGKYHQVKRMVKSAGSEVLYLKRLSMGKLVLDENLSLGEYRTLTSEEIRQLKEHTC